MDILNPAPARHFVKGGVAAVGFFLFAVSLASPTRSVAAPAAEILVKAAYLAKFGAFIDWPPNAFAAPSSPFNLCVIGSDPFGAALDNLVAGQAIAAHPVAIKRPASASAAADCQIAFIADSDPARVAGSVKALEGSGVLTVTDTGAQTAGSGIINFVIEGDHVRFGINNGEAVRDGLAISSRLLSLALYVSRP